MAQYNFGGTNTSVIGFTDAYVISPIALPAGPRKSADGKFWALITNLKAYASGKGATRTMSLSLDGVGGTGNFSRGSAGSAGDTGWHGCSLLVDGGSANFRITSSGSFYFGRGGSGSTTDNNGLHRTDGALGGSMLYAYTPSAPAAPSASSPIPGRIDLVWDAPTDNGGAGITGYVLQRADDANFETNVTEFDVAASPRAYSDVTVEPGKTYWYRVYALNAVTAAADTRSLASTSTSLASLAGGHRWTGSSEIQTGTAVRWDGTKEVPLTVAVMWDGTQEVALT